MINRMRQYFNERAQEKQRRARAKALINDVKTAIENKNITALNDAVDTILMDYDENVLKKEHRDLLFSAIETKDTDVFKAVYSLLPDPNFMFVWHHGMPGGGIHITVFEPVLERCIEKGTEDMALFIAEQPAFDPRVQGAKQTWRFHSSGGIFEAGRSEKTTTYSNDFRKIAADHGMESLATVLNEREADALTAEAAELNRRADALRGPGPFRVQ
ncbi:MAG: hypothetical protein QF692_04845 [Alphaproteobacteria bacterium]|nr:hypothetical protein [Alphaproteobacteria bacterium]MDP7222577.1 hypothetical protein [Alphaproteobacteria bacterium]